MGSGAPAVSEVEAARSKMLADIGAWAGNVSTSVFIVFVNKLLMKTFGYHFATTLVSAMVGARGGGRWRAARPAALPPTATCRSLAAPPDAPSRPTHLPLADRAALPGLRHRHLVCAAGRQDQADLHALQRCGTRGGSRPTRDAAPRTAPHSSAAVPSPPPPSARPCRRSYAVHLCRRYLYSHPQPVAHAQHCQLLPGAAACQWSHGRLGGG